MSPPAELTLTDGERRRIEHIDRLVTLGGQSVPELIAALDDSSWTVRRAVVAALAALGDDAVAPLCEWLRARRTTEHGIAAAVDALATSTGSTASRALAPLLEVADPAIVADAIAIAGRRGAAELGPRIITLLDDANDNVVVAAIEALGRLGAGIAIEPLVAVVRRRNFFQTFPAIQVLAGTHDPRIIAPLSELLDDPLFAPAAIAALGRSGLPGALPPLLALLDIADLERTRTVAAALADLLVTAAWSGTTSKIVPALHTAPGIGEVLRAALPGARREERVAIATLLGTVGDPESLPLLVGLLDEPTCRTAATEAIQQIAALHDDALLDLLNRGTAAMRIALLPIVHTTNSIAVVQSLLADDEPEVRARACEALARIGNTSVVDALFAALDDDHPRVAHAATGAIHSLGGERARALAVAALGATGPARRRHALRIVAYLGITEAFQAVRAAIDDPDARLAELAITALAALEDPRTDPILVELARDPDPARRAAATRGAAQRTSEVTTELLVRALTDDAPWVRYYACQGLARTRHAPAIPAIVERLADPSPHVRIAAIEALAALDAPAARQALTAATRSNDPDERRAALVGLGHGDHAHALPLLLEAAAGEDVATRLVALAGLGRSSDPAALAALARAARSEHDELRDAALSLLADRNDPPAAHTLVELALGAPLDHPVHLTLSRPTPSRITAIGERLEHANEPEAPILVAALARMDVPAALAALAAARSAASAPARRAAATALVALGTSDARTVAQQLAAHDADPEVRRACRAALEVA